MQYFQNKLFKYIVVLTTVAGILLLPMPWRGGAVRQAKADTESAIDWGTKAGATCLEAGAGAYSIICAAVGGILGFLFGGGPSIEDLYKNKEYSDDPKAWTQSEEDLATLQNTILDVIQTGGPDGGPTWESDWYHFTQKQQDLGEHMFQAELFEAALGDNATICPYMADAIAEAFGAKYDPAYEDNANGQFRINNSQPFIMRVKCTLPEDFDYAAYLADPNFNEEVYYALQEPQNNMTGLGQLVAEERQNVIIAQTETADKLLSANGGNHGVIDPVTGEVKTSGGLVNAAGAWVYGPLGSKNRLGDENGKVMTRLKQ